MIHWVSHETKNTKITIVGVWKNEMLPRMGIPFSEMHKGRSANIHYDKNEWVLTLLKCLPSSEEKFYVVR